MAERLEARLIWSITVNPRRPEKACWARAAAVTAGDGLHFSVQRAYE